MLFMYVPFMKVLIKINFFVYFVFLGDDQALFSVFLISDF